MEDEIEILKSIFEEDIVSINSSGDNPSLEITLYPANSENYNNKFIKLNLLVYFPENVRLV
jgi:hypothetical protein